MKHKKQHWVPQCYLKAWCDPDARESHDPYVWCFSKDGAVVKRRAPKNLFFENELYTIHLVDGERDLSVEHGLAGLEDAFVSVRDGRLSGRASLSPQDDLLLRAFAGAMKSRTRGHLEHMQRQFKSALDMGESIREQMTAMSPSERLKMAPSVGPVEPRPGMTLDEVRELAEGSVGPLVVAEVQAQLPILSQMSLAVLCTAEPVGFITSDMPCVWFDPEAYKRPWPLGGVGLGWRTVEITMPVSPRQLMLLNWQSVEGYLDITPEQVDDFNRRTRFWCDACFIACKTEKRDIWFDPGAPPEDARPASE